MALLQCFATTIYRARLPAKTAPRLNRDLERAMIAQAAEDRAGQAWSRANRYAGYTSYASLNDLSWRSPPFADLAALIAPHVAGFAKAQAFDLGRRKLKLDSLWVNVLDAKGTHSGHIHPHSVVSGTYYVSVPKGAGAIRFEDPRLPLMMAAPPRKASAPQAMRPFVYIEPARGELLLWESWLRHEVVAGSAARPRLSVSFNYA